MNNRQPSKRSRSKRTARDQRRLCRRSDLQIHALDDGCVVYQPDPDRVHFLNLTAAWVLELCDGRNGFQDIEREVSASSGAARPKRRLTGAIIEQFIREDLITVNSK